MEARSQMSITWCVVRKCMLPGSVTSVSLDDWKHLLLLSINAPGFKYLIG